MKKHFFKKKKTELALAHHTKGKYLVINYNEIGWTTVEKHAFLKRKVGQLIINKKQNLKKMFVHLL